MPSHMWVCPRCSPVFFFTCFRRYRTAVRIRTYWDVYTCMCRSRTYISSTYILVHTCTCIVLYVRLGVSWTTVRMRVSAHCADAFLNISFSGFYRTGVRWLRPVRRQRTLLCGIRIKSFGTRFFSVPLCGDSEREVVELWNAVLGVVWSSS